MGTSAFTSIFIAAAISYQLHCSMQDQLMLCPIARVNAVQVTSRCTCGYTIGIVRLRGRGRARRKTATNFSLLAYKRTCHA